MSTRMVTWVTRSVGSGFAESSQGALPGTLGLAVLWGLGEHLVFMVPHDTTQAPTAPQGLSDS